MGSAINSITNTAKNPIGLATNISTMGMAGYDPNKGFTRGVQTEALNQATGGELSKIAGDLKDTLLGKKTPGTPDEVIDLASPQGRALQEQLLTQYGQLAGQDTNQMAANQIAGQEAQAIQLAQDQATRAQQLVAQRGLGRTASGISQILGQQRGLGEQLSGIRAQLPGLQQQLKQQNLGFASSGINQILNEQGQSKVLKMGQQAQGRSGGLVAAALPIAGQVLGGMAGAGAFGGIGGALGASAGGAAGAAAGGSMAGYSPNRYSMGAF